MQAAFTGRLERLDHPLLPIDESHFLIPPGDATEDPTTCAIYEVEGVRYLHTNCRVHPLVG